MTPRLLNDALNVLVKDQLEIASGASMSLTVGIPGPQDWNALRKDALVQHIKDRQASIAARFPEERWGL